MIYSNFFDRRKNTFEKSYELILQNIKENICYNIIIKVIKITKMDNIIKCDRVDFNALVTKNNMDKSLNFRSKIVDQLNNTFTDDEKRWYISNLYMYLNYHPTDE